MLNGLARLEAVSLRPSENAILPGPAVPYGTIATSVLLAPMVLLELCVRNLITIQSQALSDTVTKFHPARLGGDKKKS